MEIDGHEVKVSSPGKVFFPEHGETKLDLVEHYLRFAEPVMRTMGGRPTLMQRFPEGAGGPSFFQKRVPQGHPRLAADDGRQHAERHDVARARGRRPRPRRVGGEHRDVSASTRGRTSPPTPTTPTSSASTSTRSRAPTSRTSARPPRVVHALLDEVGVTGYPKTTGNRGLHVYVRLEPRWDSYQVRWAAVAIARELERRHPDIVTAAWWKEERGERVFLDYNQNAPHKTVFGAWSARARVGGQVSTPLRWEDDRRGASRRAHARHVAGTHRGRRRPVGGHERRPAVARAVPRDARARPGERPHGRALAARLPEAARRAAAGRAEPGEEG